MGSDWSSRLAVSIVRGTFRGPVSRRFRTTLLFPICLPPRVYAPAAVSQETACS